MNTSSRTKLESLLLRNEKRISTLMEGNARNGDSDISLVAQNDDDLANDGLIPQLFTSVPSLNHAASYLAQTTSFFTSCFSDYSVDSGPVGLENSSSDEREMMTISSKEAVGLQLVVNDCQASRIIQSKFSDLPGSSTSASIVIDDETRTTLKKSSPNVGTLVESTNSAGNGISIFQGLIERTRRTIRGSADDIGWLQRCSGMPPVEDGTERFMEILDNIRHGIHRLPNTVVYLFIPGLFSNHGPLYFVNTKLSFSKMGLACHIAKIHSEASVEKNARELKEYIEEIYWGSRKRVLLLGHSKGGVDAAAALSLYWSDLKDKVAGLALAQSPYGGSPIASDILREGQLGDYVYIRKIMEILICKVIKGDMQALEDLTYQKRKKFLMTHLLPEELPVVSFHTEASISPAVLATLSRVAHAELPLAPRSIGQPAKLPVIVPLGATMAACAQLLQVRYGEKSDGLVTRQDAEVPGSVVVRPRRKLDHGWMVYSDLNDDPSEANASQVCEALLTLLVEVGHKKRPEIGMQNEEDQ